MGIDYGLSEVPSTFGFFDYLYVLTSKLTIEDRSSIATYLNDVFTPFSFFIIENQSIWFFYDGKLSKICIYFLDE